MAARNAALHFFTRLGMVLGAVFALTVILAAMPGHNSPAMAPVPVQLHSSPSKQSGSRPMADMDHSQMDSADQKAAENSAMDAMSMSDGHGSNQHMYMTAERPIAPGDVQRAEAVVAQLRVALEKYKDYQVALNDGYRIFLPNVPQSEYHLTKYRNGFLEGFRFDPSEPTSLHYRKTDSGYELVGTMYTMPRRSTEDQLNERIPLSIARWHLHTNLCLPPLGQLRTADWTKFGLRGSITTEWACEAAGGRFHPVVLGWMVHVYPYEASLDKIFTMHHAH